MTILFDARSAATLRITGWERYTRSLLGIVCDWNDVAVIATPTEALIPRLRSDWITIPAVSRKADLTHFPTFPPAPTNRLRRALFTIHDLVWWRHPELSSRLGRHYYRRLSAFSASHGYLSTVSRTVRTEILERYPNATVHVVSPYPQLAQQLPVPFSDVTTPFILAVGTIEPRKNLARLTEAFQLSGIAADFQLVLVGRRAWGDIPRGVHLAEGVNDGQLRWLMEHAAALFCPSLYEGFGLTPVEAISLGTPVFCSDLPIFHETAPQASGYFDPTDIGHIAENLRLAASFSITPRDPCPTTQYSRERTSAELRMAYDQCLS